MWLITTLVAALFTTAMWIFLKKRYKLGFLSMMLWGASVMIFIDHVMGYEGGEFIQMTTEGMITNGTVLGIAMLIPLFIIWEVYLIISLRGEKMMACFMFAMGLGIITLLLRKFFPKRLHIEWLNAILWGAVLMLSVEHLAHGEIVLYPPFLTSGFSRVIPEMISVGGTMTAFSTGLWASMVGVNELMQKKVNVFRKTTTIKRI